MFDKSIFLVLVLTLALFYGCGGGGEDTTPGTTAPTVSSTIPSSGATGVSANSSITATFSENMDSSTITGTTFTLKDSSNNPVTASVSYDSGTKTATLDPSSDLSVGITYTATITADVKNSIGTAVSEHKWNFTTNTVSFASEIQPIFTSSCISCHQTGGTSSFLPLTTGVSYNNLVNQTSTYTTGGTLVIPGNSADSVLYKRISGNTVGLQMPRLLAPLSTSDQNLIQTWIDEGANNN